MSLNVYSTSVSAIGYAADLGVSDSAFIATGAAIVFDHNAAEGNAMIVGAMGMVKSGDDSAISSSSNGQFFDIAGTVKGAANGINLSGGTPTTTATTHIVNRGTISGHYAGISVDNEDLVVLRNSGVIRGVYSYFDMYGAADNITNTGKIIGSVYLSSSDDVFDGRHGIQNGLIDAGSGNDRIYGGDHSDKISGNRGADIITGGGGADVFVFQSALDSIPDASGRDLITDFSQSQHDLMDLTLVAPSPIPGTTDHLTFIGAQAFSGQSDELRYTFHHGHTLVSADINGDRHADFEIVLGTHVVLVEGDFVL